MTAPPILVATDEHRPNCRLTPPPISHPLNRTRLSPTVQENGGLLGHLSSGIRLLELGAVRRDQNRLATSAEATDAHNNVPFQRHEVLSMSATNRCSLWSIAFWFSASSSFFRFASSMVRICWTTP